MPTVPISSDMRPFALDDAFRSVPTGRLLSPVRPALERLLGLAQLNAVYAALPNGGAAFHDRALEALGITNDVSAGDLERVPRSGPLVVVANHPFGAVDGLALIQLLHRVRPDVKLMGNYLLGRIRELRDSIIAVDPFGSRSRRPRNAVALRFALRWIESGHVLAVFPSGEVSHTGGPDGGVIDPEWSSTIAGLIRRAAAPVLPVFFAGSNSALFRLAGHVHPRLRTVLLPRELLKQRNRCLTIRVGTPVSPDRIAAIPDLENVTAYLRLRTYALGRTPADGSTSSERAVKRSVVGIGGTAAAVASAEHPALLRQEIDALPDDRVLLRSGTFRVCIGRAAELPRTLLEIGRLRELTFRTVGEGSGLARDLDRFDQHYRHLLVWNDARDEVVGAYRLGATDEIVPHTGVGGLYTSTLFRYDLALLSQIAPALELGRAFVREEYQRDYSPLMLLWKGIATYVTMNPRYRMLYGPVSISNDYHSFSRQLLARFLYATSYRADLARHVNARNPPPFLRRLDRQSPIFGTIVKSLAEVGTLVAEIEHDQKSVPVLLRQYLRLNARLLGFNLDPSFGNALDGLMLVDLTQVDRAILTRYMGAGRLSAFLEYHRAAAEATPRAEASRPR
jgi:putative hemolysin